MPPSQACTAISRERPAAISVRTGCWRMGLVVLPALELGPAPQPASVGTLWRSWTPFRCSVMASSPFPFEVKTEWCRPSSDSSSGNAKSSNCRTGGLVSHTNEPA
ncbi:hypothetical protein ACKKBG_A03305 [Auxenochlorella protothecoides x Auxenochlorella symbiontica]